MFSLKGIFSSTSQAEAFSKELENWYLQNNGERINTCRMGMGWSNPLYI